MNGWMAKCAKAYPAAPIGAAPGNVSTLATAIFSPQIQRTACHPHVAPTPETAPSMACVVVEMGTFAIVARPIVIAVVISARRHRLLCVAALANGMIEDRIRFASKRLSLPRSQSFQESCLHPESHVVGEQVDRSEILSRSSGKLYDATATIGFTIEDGEVSVHQGKTENREPGTSLSDGRHRPTCFLCV
jgi:hypothetical protein